MRGQRFRGPAGEYIAASTRVLLLGATLVAAALTIPLVGRAQPPVGFEPSGAPQAPDSSGLVIGGPVAAQSFDGSLADLERVDLRAVQEIENHRAKGALMMSDVAQEPDPLVQLVPGQRRAMSGPLLNFAGIGFTGFRPPDTVGDVGPNHYVQMVNVSFSVFNKAGVLLAGPSVINSLWQGVNQPPCSNQNAGDPVVVYDQLANRWVLSQFASPSHVCIAVSKTPDPVVGGYWLYTFNVGSFPDYFKLGVWPDAYYMAANFGNSVLAAAMQRSQMLNGQPAAIHTFTRPALPNHGAMMLPSDHDGPIAPPAGSPNLFYRQYDASIVPGAGNDRLELWSFAVNFAGASSFTGPVNVFTAPFDSSTCGFFSFACVPQPGTFSTLDPINEWPMFPFRYRNYGTHESVVGNFTVDANGADGHGIRWFELRRTGGIGAPWVLQNEGTYAPLSGGNFLHRWIGANALDGAGNMALGYSVSSTTVFPGIRYAGRHAADPAGQLPQGEVTLQGGAGSQTNSSRWGDYASMSVDPVDNCTFWYTNQYQVVSGGGWLTRIGAFRFDNCLPDLVVEDITTNPIQPAPGQNVTVTVHIKNNGGRAYPNFGVDFYKHSASQPGTGVAGDVSCTKSGLAAGATSTCVGTVSYASAGTVSMWARIDRGNTVVESNESNNVFGPESLTVGGGANQPDLTVLSIATNPTNPSPGQTVNVTVTVRNNGTAATPSGFGVDFYKHSASAPANAAGDFSCALSALAASTNAVCTGTTSYPSSGTFQMWAWVDRTGTIAESNEGNNVLGPQNITISTTGTVDLVISAVTAPTGANPGQTISVTVKTRNIGTSQAPASTTLLRLSANKAIDGADPVLATISVPTLAPGTTNQQTVPATIPAATPLSKRFLLANADNPGAIGEANETNNLKSRALTVGPDYVVSKLVVPTPITKGTNFTITEATKNNGGAAGIQTTTRFYLSPDKNLNVGTDVLLGSRTIPGLNNAQASQASTNLLMPASTASGTWFIIAVSDAQSQLAEAVETNNRKVSQAITVQ